jgi:toxin ParE1/3/4
VVVTPEAQEDLLALYDYVSDAASSAVADRYLARLERYLGGFEYAAERGTLRDDIRRGLRVVGFERRVTIAFAVSDTTVTVLRLFYGGQSWDET